MLTFMNAIIWIIQFFFVPLHPQKIIYPLIR